MEAIRLLANHRKIPAQTCNCRDAKFAGSSMIGTRGKAGLLYGFATCRAPKPPNAWEHFHRSGGTRAQLTVSLPLALLRFESPAVPYRDISGITRGAAKSPLDAGI
jgi:hypothetical protein